jgi:hypothetical protein
MADRLNAKRCYALTAPKKVELDGRISQTAQQSAQQTRIEGVAGADMRGRRDRRTRKLLRHCGGILPGIRQSLRIRGSDISAHIINSPYGTFVQVNETGTECKWGRQPRPVSEPEYIT